MCADMCSLNAYAHSLTRRQAHFLGAFKIEDAPDADNLTSTLIAALRDVAKLTPHQIGTKLMGAAADGASVMAGERTGVLKVCMLER